MTVIRYVSNQWWKWQSWKKIESFTLQNKIRFVSRRVEAVVVSINGTEVFFMSVVVICFPEVKTSAPSFSRSMRKSVKKLVITPALKSSRCLSRRPPWERSWCSACPSKTPVKSTLTFYYHHVFRADCKNINKTGIKKIHGFYLLKISTVVCKCLDKKTHQNRPDL